MILKYNLPNNEKNINGFLLKQGLSHRLLLSLKRHNCIEINDTNLIVNLDYEEESENIVPSKINLDIVHEDDALLVLNKPAGIPVHPSLHYYESSLSNGVKNYFNSLGLKKMIRPVNRLDKNTSGLVVFAKNAYVQEELIKQMKSGQFKKKYIALLTGILNEKKRNY